MTGKAVQVAKVQPEEGDVLSGPVSGRAEDIPGFKERVLPALAQEWAKHVFLRDVVGVPHHEVPEHEGSVAMLLLWDCEEEFAIPSHFATWAEAARSLQVTAMVTIATE